MKNDTTEHSIPKEVITYAAGKIEAGLAEIARDTKQPEQELRQWVAIFLLTSWEGLSNSMPTLRRKATKIYPTTRKMAMVNNSHPKSSKKPSDSSNPVKHYPKRRSGIKKFWASMTAEQRIIEMKRRRALGMRKAA